MKVDCAGDAPFNEMFCTFYTVTISPAKLPDDFESQVEETTRALCASDTRSKLCNEVEQNPLTRPDANEPLGRWQLIAEGKLLFQQLCACVDESCRRGIARKIIANPYESVCKVHQFVSLEQRFRRTGDRSWIATIEAPACNVVTVMILEHEPGSEFQWTLTQTRTGKPDMTNPLCAAMDINKPLIYSWRFKPNTRLQCSSIAF